MQHQLAACICVNARMQAPVEWPVCTRIWGEHEQHFCVDK